MKSKIKKKLYKLILLFLIFGFERVVYAEVETENTIDIVVEQEKET